MSANGANINPEFSTSVKNKQWMDVGKWPGCAKMQVWLWMNDKVTHYDFDEDGVTKLGLVLGKSPICYSTIFNEHNLNGLCYSTVAKAVRGLVKSGLIRSHRVNGGCRYEVVDTDKKVKQWGESASESEDGVITAIGRDGKKIRAVRNPNASQSPVPKPETIMCKYCNVIHTVDSRESWPCESDRNSGRPFCQDCDLYHYPSDCPELEVDPITPKNQPKTINFDDDEIA